MSHRNEKTILKYAHISIDRITNTMRIILYNNCHFFQAEEYVDMIITKSMLNSYKPEESTSSTSSDENIANLDSQSADISSKFNVPVLDASDISLAQQPYLDTTPEDINQIQQSCSDFPSMPDAPYELKPVINIPDISSIFKPEHVRDTPSDLIHTNSTAPQILNRNSGEGLESQLKSSVIDQSSNYQHSVVQPAKENMSSPLTTINSLHSTVMDILLPTYSKSNKGVNIVQLPRGNNVIVNSTESFAVASDTNSTEGNVETLIQQIRERM